MSVPRVPRVTLLDVARHAGVSRTTASFVMTGRRDKRVSAEAEERVLRAARELNYRPNLLARSLRTKLGHTIGVISDVVASEPFAGELIRGCLTAALRNEHLVFVGESAGDPAVERQLAQSMLDRGVSGFLLASMFTREVRVPAVLSAHRLVLVNCVSAGRPLPAVVPDERAAGVAATAVLLDAGHREGIYLVGETPATVLAAQRRRAGVEAALQARGCALAGEVACLWWPESAYRAVRDLLDHTRPAALICLNDRIALGAYQALSEVGRCVPEDVSVVSFDDSDLARWLRPPLTSVAIPHFDLARTAVELLLSDGQPEPCVRLVPMPLRLRDSVRNNPSSATV